MIDIVSLKNMRESDANCIANEVPSLELMRRAGLVIYKSLSWKGNVNIVVGKGNNGGDGYALACILAREGYSPVVYKLSDDVSDDSFYFEKQAKELGVIINEYIPSLNQLDSADIIVDCLLGTGFKGKVEGNYASCIKEINSYQNAFVVSADINSGVNGDNGPGSLYVKSTLTVCIQAFKKGMLVNTLDYVKNIAVGDIGIKLLYEEDKLATSVEFNSTKGNNIYKDKELNYYYEGNHKVYECPSNIKLKVLSYK